MIPPYVILLASFTAIFALVVLLPVLIELRRRRDRGPRLFPETTVVEEKPRIPPPPEDARPEPLERPPFIGKPKRAHRIGETIRAVGDVRVPSGTEIVENVIVDGRLWIGGSCHLLSSVKATGGVEIGAGTVIEGNVISGQSIAVGPSATIKGVIDAAEDVTLHEDVSVGSVSAGRTIRLGLNAKVKNRIQAGESVVALAAPKPPVRPVAPTIALKRAVLPLVRSGEMLKLDELLTTERIDIGEYIRRRRELVARLSVTEKGPEARRPPNLEEFYGKLREAYARLRETRSGITRMYVEISELRSVVCRELAIDEAGFDDMLSRIVEMYPGSIDLEAAPYAIARLRPGFEHDGHRYAYIRVRRR